MAVSDGRVLTMGDLADGQFLIAFSAETGEHLWQSRVGSAFANDRGGGARSTPTVDGAFIRWERTGTCPATGSRTAYWSGP
jgi:hypothetical protein